MLRLLRSTVSRANVFSCREIHTYWKMVGWNIIIVRVVREITQINDVLVKGCSNEQQLLMMTYIISEVTLFFNTITNRNYYIHTGLCIVEQDSYSTWINGIVNRGVSYIVTAAERTLTLIGFCYFWHFFKDFTSKKKACSEIYINYLRAQWLLWVVLYLKIQYYYTCTIWLYNITIHLYTSDDLFPETKIGPYNNLVC